MSGQKRYPCALCGRREPLEKLLYSRWTRNRYCRDIRGCERRARRLQRQLPAGLPPEQGG